MGGLLRSSLAKNRLPVDWRDPWFRLALVAGPAAVGLLWLLLSPSPQWDWPLRGPVFFLLLVLVYPVLEEGAFRGFIQPYLREKTALAWGPLSLANLLTSVLFVAAHMLVHTPLWAALVLLPSLIFGVFLERHGSLAAPIVLHVSYNAVFFWVFVPASVLTSLPFTG